MKIIKTISIFILSLVLAIYCCAISTVGGEIIYDDENITVVFSADSQYNADEQKAIADQLVYGINDNDVLPCNILCDIFGHDLKTEYIQIIQHKADDLAPRCLKKTYEARGCRICNYIEYDLISYVYITCCPEE